jgi:hypothetical protein
MTTEYLTIHDSLDETYEPTLRDVLFAFSNLDAKFSNLDSKVIDLDRKVTSIFHSILEREDTMDTRLQTLETGSAKMQIALEDIQDELSATRAAIDRNSMILLNHDKRISDLETVIVS